MSKTDRTRITLTAIWIFVKFNVLSADLLGFLDGNFLKQLIDTGKAGEVTITPTFLLIAAVLLEINIVMILISRLAPYKINRLLNLMAAPIVIAFIIGGGSMTPHYLFFATLECMALLAIMVITWRWREN